MRPSGHCVQGHAHITHCHCPLDNSTRGSGLPSLLMTSSSTLHPYCVKGECMHLWPAGAMVRYKWIMVDFAEVPTHSLEYLSHSCTGLYRLRLPLVNQLPHTHSRTILHTPTLTSLPRISLRHLPTLCLPCSETGQSWVPPGADHCRHSLCPRCGLLLFLLNTTWTSAGSVQLRHY